MSAPRKSTGYKPGRGIDGTKGENWAPDSDIRVQYNQKDAHGERDPYDQHSQNTGPKSGDKWLEDCSQWGPSAGRVSGINEQSSGRPAGRAHKDDNVTSGSDFGQRAGTRDIWNDVWSNAYASPDGDYSLTNSGGGRSGPVKYGVNRSQTDGAKKISHE
jgi:hypothetical protein